MIYDLLPHNQDSLYGVKQTYLTNPGIYFNDSHIIRFKISFRIQPCMTYNMVFRVTNAIRGLKQVLCSVSVTSE